MKKLLLLLLFQPFWTFAYNLDGENAIIIDSPVSDQDIGANTFFGFSVILYTKNVTYSNGVTHRFSWIIIGAPKGNYTGRADHGFHIPNEPGMGYMCTVPETDVKPAFCSPLNVTNPDNEVGFIEQLKLNTLIEKEHSWFGAAMSVHRATGTITVCAPRTVIKIYNAHDVNYNITMQGACYTGDMFSDKLRMNEKDLSTHDFSASFWPNPMNGFAVHYPSSRKKVRSDLFRPVIGSPKHQLVGAVHEIGQQYRTALPFPDHMASFGFSLTSGYYFHEELLMVAGGAPGWQYVGQVAIMDPSSDPLSIIATVEGNELGEFFGASLATGDLNNDGLDDLIVGSPHWKDDNGRVQIFLGNKAGFLEANVVLEGAVIDAQFSYSITSGDLDDDGYDDLIVGAPWEGSGVIYIFNGDANLSEVKKLQPSQRIAASDIRRIRLLRFGFSLAKPVDVDGNGFPDVGVGAYASGHAVVILSKPVVRTNLTITTYPDTLPRNATKVTVKVCVKTASKVKESVCGFSFVTNFDEDYKRFLYGTSHIITTTVPKVYGGANCWNTTFTLRTGTLNYIDTADIIVTQRFNEYFYFRNRDYKKHERCGIEYRGSHSTVARARLSFDIGCGMDDVCEAFVIANMSFFGISNSTWLIGSGNLRLELSVGNRAEPAYSMTVTLYIPKGITMSSILASCEEGRSGEHLTITCDAGNPLGTGVEKKIIFDLDMNHMEDGSANGTTLDFRADINTLSTNRGLTSISIPLHLKANVSLALSGKANDDSYYFISNMEKPSNLTFQHNYQFSRSGATPIFEARLVIRVPFRIGNRRFLTMQDRPRVSVLGRFYDCLIVNEAAVHLDTFFAISATRLPFFELSSREKGFISRDGISDKTLPGKSKFSTVLNMPQETKRTSNPKIYVNCSNPSVECARIECSVRNLKKAQDVAKLQLKFLINDTLLTDEPNEKERIVNFMTEAFVEIVNPKFQLSVATNSSTIFVATTFHHAPSERGVSIFVILLSVFFGLVALTGIFLYLRKIGFFKRRTKEQLDSMRKSTEAISLDSEPSLVNE